MLDPQLLSILVCPATHRPLHLASAAELAAVNAAIAAGKARTRAGEAVRTPLAAALVVEGGGACYPVQDDIPILLSAEAILLESAGAAPAQPG